MLHARAAQAQGERAAQPRRRIAMSAPDTAEFAPPSPFAGNQALMRALGGARLPLRPSRAPVLQRTCACGGTCADCTARTMLNRKAAGAKPGAAPPSVHKVLRSPGAPLDNETRTDMESRFGADFGAVRVHTGTDATDSARAVNALAYAVGSHVVFAAGQYAPRSVSGQRLLAHELAHTIQQRSQDEAATSELMVSDPHAPAEREADAVAQAVLRGEAAAAVTSRPAAVARWSVSGNIATVDSATDRLGLLAQKVKSKPMNWMCIKPISMKTESYPTPPADLDAHYEKYLQIGDTFDISNLNATGGKNILRVNFHVNQDVQTLLASQNFYPGMKKISSDPDQHIATAAGEGANPLVELIMAGHAGGSSMGGACQIIPNNLSPDEPAPSLARAKSGKFPRRCWFTTDASARAIGCHSGTFASDFADVYLRVGSEIYATERSVAPSCTAEHQDPPGGGREKCTAINAMEFLPDSEPVGPDHGPFTTAKAFHGSIYWQFVTGPL